MLATLLLLGCATQGERLARREATAAKVRQAIADRHLTVSIHSMQTQRYGSHSVTSDFYLALQGDTLRSYLPFVGRAYAVSPMSPSQGLNFTAPVQQLAELPLKHGGTRLEMVVQSSEDSYVYRVDVYPNGQAYIYVRGQERDAMSYDGELQLE